jgi:hypothetical protein
VAYTDPEVAWAGITEDEAKAKGIKVEKGHFPWAASGRAVANGRAEGFTKLLFDAETHRIIGGTIVGTHAGDMIGEIALAIEMGCDPTPLYFGLLCGATLGGNCTPIGASANITGIGILRKAGYEVKNSDFFKIGIPFTLSAIIPAYILLWVFFGA